MTMKLAKAALFFTMASAAAWAQVNAGEQKPEATMPFTMTTMTTFELPWRIAFLPDGRMLVTEKVGPIWLVSAKGEKIAVVGGTPPVYWQGQSGMFGIFSRRLTPPIRMSTSRIPSRVSMAADSHSPERG